MSIYIKLIMIDYIIYLFHFLFILQQLVENTFFINSENRVKYIIILYNALKKLKLINIAINQILLINYIYYINKY